MLMLRQNKRQNIVLWFINPCYVQKSYSMYKRLAKCSQHLSQNVPLDFTKILMLYKRIHTFIHFQVRWDFIIILSNLLLLLNDFSICFSFFKLRYHRILHRRAALKSSAWYPSVDIVSERGHVSCFCSAVSIHTQKC